MQVQHVYLFLVPEIRKKPFFLLGVGRGMGGGAQVQHQLQQWAKGGGGTGATSTSAMGKVLSIGIVLYGMCSQSLYIKGEN